MMVSAAATPAALLPNRQPRPSSAVMRDEAQRSPSDPMYAAATTAIASTTAIVSGSATGSGSAAFTTFVARTEKTGITARSRKHPDTPARPNRRTRREFEYVRHGTVSIIAALDVHTGQVLTETIARNNADTFIGFLRILDATVPAGEPGLARAATADPTPI